MLVSNGTGVSGSDIVPYGIGWISRFLLAAFALCGCVGRIASSDNQGRFTPPLEVGWACNGAWVSGSDVDSVDGNRLDLGGG